MCQSYVSKCRSQAIHLLDCHRACFVNQTTIFLLSRESTKSEIKSLSTLNQRLLPIPHLIKHYCHVWVKIKLFVQKSLQVCASSIGGTACYRIIHPLKKQSQINKLSLKTSQYYQGNENLRNQDPEKKRITVGL